MTRKTRRKTVLVVRGDATTRPEHPTRAPHYSSSTAVAAKTPHLTAAEARARCNYPSLIDIKLNGLLSENHFHPFRVLFALISTFHSVVRGKDQKDVESKVQKDTHNMNIYSRGRAYEVQK